MRSIRKTSFLISFLAFISLMSCQVDISDDVLLEITNNGQIIKGWMHQDTLTFFVPSYVKPEDLRIVNAKKQSVIIANRVISKYEGNSTLSIKFDSCYSIVIGRGEYVIELLRSENVATLYINTETGDDSHLNSNKNNKEKCSISIVDYANNINVFSDNLSATIKGRGSSTWREEKKPYTINFKSKQSVLGMKPAKKWILLANAFDETNLRNKIVYDFGRNLNYGYVPDSRFADVYLNGKYLGLYLITEKVEVNKSRLWVADCDSVYLFHQTSPGQAYGKNNTFLTENGQNIEIDYPKIKTQHEALFMVNLVNEMEELIMGGEDEKNLSRIDVESWAIKYLVDEIFENTDCNFISSYFYVTIRNGKAKYFGGPIWDYDLSIGNNWANYEPDMFYARREWKGKDIFTPYYQCLIGNEKVRAVVNDIYYNRMRPKLDSLIYGGIKEAADRIDKASILNSKRWRHRFDKIQKERHSAKNKSIDSLTDHLRNRIILLDKFFADENSYVIVTYETTTRMDAYCYIFLRKGERINTLPTADSLGYWRLYWRERGQDDVFNTNVPIMNSVILDIDDGKSFRKLNRNNIEYSLRRVLKRN